MSGLMIAACMVTGLCCGIWICVIYYDISSKNKEKIEINPCKTYLTDGKLYLDLLDDPPLNMELKIGVGELLERDTILLEVVDLNKGLNDIQEEIDV